MLLILDTTTRTLKAKMDMAAMTTNCSIIVAYADHDGTNFTEGVDPTTLNGTTAVTILSAPASATRRVVKSITVYNPDDETHTTTLIFNDNGTEYGITRLTLPPGASWSSDDQTGVNVGGALTDGDKGDISVSGGGDTWTIDTNAVTLTKLAQISSGSFLGRSTAGTGNVEEIGSTGSGNVVRATSATLTAPSIAALANLTTNGFVRTSSGNGTLSIDTNTYLTTNQAITLSGDVTGTGTTGITATIANQAVSYAKIQNVSVTSRILGRRSAGAGSIEEMTLSQTLDLIGSAAQGDILYRGASGWARLAAGTNGQFLRTSGAGADPAWATIAAGLTVGTTTITSGTSGNVLYNNGGVLGEYTTVPVSEGGTGSSSLTANNVLLGNGTSALQVVAPGTSGNVLTSNGTTWTSSAPAGGGGSNSICDGRLTLSSTDPVTTTNVNEDDTAAGTLYFLPYTGNKIALYTGSAWQVYEWSSASLNLSSLSAHVIYDIFAYASGSTVTLEAVSWGTNTEYSITNITASANVTVTFNAVAGVHPLSTGTHVCIFGCTGTNASTINNVWTVTGSGGSSGAYTAILDYVSTASGAPTVTNGKIRALDNTRSTTLTRLNGVLVSNSNNTRRYLGTIKISGTAGRAADSTSRRFVYNYYNQVKRLLTAYELTNNWSYAGNVWRPYNGLATNRVELIMGTQEQVVKIDACGMSTSTGNGYGLNAVSIDSTTTIASDDFGRIYLASQPSTASAYGYLPGYGTYEDTTAVGYHYFVAMEKNNGSTSTTFASYFDQLRNAGLGGEVMA